MKHTFFLFLFSLLLLAACEKENPPQATSTAAPSALPTEIRLPITPGVRAFDHLEIVSSNMFHNDTYGWVALEIKNNNPFHVTNYLITLTLLDENHLELETFPASTPFFKIPAGYSLPVVIEFALPEGYADFLAQVEMDTAYNPNSQALTAVYDLPHTLDPPTSTELPMTLTGTITNDRPQELITPVVVVALYDEQGNILSAAGASLGEKTSLLPGETVPFQATFSMLPTTSFDEIRVVSAGYVFESD